MSRKGNCLDNVIMEKFFGILKQEIYYGHTFNAYEELKKRSKTILNTITPNASRKKLDFMSQ